MPLPHLPISSSPPTTHTVTKRRTICGRCERPTPAACICKALPKTRVQLRNCHCIVLQHPDEVKRKNRSLPFVEHCLDASSLTVIVGRKFGEGVLEGLIPSNDGPLWLLYMDNTSPNAVSLSQALEQHQQSAHESPSSPLVTLVFLDATWKYARDMHRRNSYPPHVLQISLNLDDFAALDKFNGNGFKPRRFDIRTPPSDRHLSTAECLAYTVSRIEHDNFTIYQTIMRPLDLMVQQWHAFAEAKKQRQAAEDVDGAGTLGV